MLTGFTNEYKFINRLLPVYKVNFDRADRIRIYVETGQDRFAFAMDNKRAVFDKIFGAFHTWEWMNLLGNTKYYIMLLFTGTAFLTTLMGLYIFFSTKTKKANGNPVIKARTRHRWTSLSLSLFTLLFTGSGGYHAFKKLTPDTADQFFTKNIFSQQDAALHLPKLQSAAGTENSIINVSLVNINGVLYWQVPIKKTRLPGTEQEQAAQDLMNSMSVLPGTTLYIKTTDYRVLPGGEEKYAAYLATLFSQHGAATIKKIEQVTKFAGEYGFVNKRLPVWKINYSINSNERFYVETATGKLAVRLDDRNLTEGYSFALFHKHEFMAWAGKPVKDFSTMFWATAQIVMVVVGLVLYFKMKRRKKLPEA